MPHVDILHEIPLSRQELLCYVLMPTYGIDLLFSALQGIKDNKKGKKGLRDIHSEMLRRLAKAGACQLEFHQG